MTVVMKGGTSGNRFDARVAMPEQKSQPLLNTATNAKADNTLFVAEQHRGVHQAQQATPDFMPNGCTIPEDSTDVSDPGA